MSDSRIAANPRSGSFDVMKYPFYLINRTMGRYNAIIASRLREIGLTIPAWRILMVLGDNNELSVGQLSGATAINLSTAARVLQRMEKAQLVSLSQAPDDARVTQVSVAEQGRLRLQAARRLTAPVYESAIEGFTAAEFEFFIATVSRVYSNLSKVA